jgi:hypothetical protein
MRELNEFNKIVMQTFTSKQAYTQIKGHYIPIIMEGVADESVKEIEKRKYYIANYTFIMKGLLIDEAEFKVSPAVTRQVSLFETETRNTSRRVKLEPSRPDNFDLDLLFVAGNNQLSEVFRYTVDLKVTELENVSSYDVFINSNYVGTDLTTIQINDGDTFLITVTKANLLAESKIKTVSYLV